MRSGICLLAGAYSLQWLNTLPPASHLALILVAALVALPWRYLQPAACMSIGFAVMGIAANSGLEDRLVPSLAGQDLHITVKVIGFPRFEGDVLRFLAAPVANPGLPKTLRLSWAETDARPTPGEQWRLFVRLRRPTGYSNPGGFDQDAWLFREGIGATGYVLAERHNYRIIGATPGLLDRMRRYVVERLQAELPAGRARAVLMAIAVGARQEFERADWISSPGPARVI